jgi:hypothetical protein
MKRLTLGVVVVFRGRDGRVRLLSGEAKRAATWQTDGAPITDESYA